MNTTLKYENAYGEVVEIKVPAHYEVCPRCKGRGTHDHHALNGFTSSEWHEMDIEDRESYMAGNYDVICTRCKGQRVVLCVDWDEVERRTKTDPELAKQIAEYNEYVEYEGLCDWEAEQERKMGA